MTTIGRTTTLVLVSCRDLAHGHPRRKRDDEQNARSVFHGALVRERVRDGYWISSRLF